MDKAANTVQVVLLQLANVLEPLQREFAPGRASGTIAELGIVITPAQESAIATPLETITGSAMALLQVAGELTAAIDAEEIDDIISATIRLTSQIAITIQSINGLQTAVDGLGGIPPAVVDKIPERLFNHLLVRALENARGVNELLELLGILDRQYFNQGSTDPGNPPHAISTFGFSYINKWLESPLEALQSLYQWGDPAFDGLQLLQKLEKLLILQGAPAFFDPTALPPSLDVLFLQLKPRTDLNPKGLELNIRQSFNPATITTATNDVKMEFEIGFKLPFATEMLLQPDADFTFTPPDLSDSLVGTLEFRLIADRSDAALPYSIIGEPGGSRLEVRKFETAVGGRVQSSNASFDGVFEISGLVQGGKLVISLAGADGFIGDIVSDSGFESDFDLGFGYSSAEGLYFIGSSTLEIQLPLHLDLGLIDISALTISVGIGNQEFPAAISANIRAALGPLNATVEGIGFKADFALKDNRDGNAGPLDIKLGFKPPLGVSLSLDAGVVKGGGYLRFDPDNEQYDGALELVFSEFLTLKAIGLITTRMPDGSKGFSLLIIITAEFGTPLQLGFGFTLIGVGGLLGLNRTMRIDVLATGVRTGAVNSVMFPTDIIANAPRIISDLREFFPPAEDIFLIGPMAKLGWGTPALVTATLGVIIEIPPGNIVILGVLKVALPDENAALIILQVNFIGALEVEKQRLWFFAAMYDSRIIFMTIEGEMGLLVAWGADANFVLSVGGFHPSFNPPPLPFPNPKRVAVSILNESFASVRIEGYFAVTSNTVQFGARAELFFGLSEFRIEGYISFDALFQFSPFYFIITISASLDVKVFGVGLFSVYMRGELEGTSPWHIEGEGGISLLFFSIDVPFSHTWGENEDTTLPPIQVMHLLEAEFNKLDNWTAELPNSSNLSVSLRTIEATKDLVLHPVGVLRVSQRAVPLELVLDKIGNQKPADVNLVSIDVTGTDLEKHSDTQEKFAIAQFKDLSDSQKLSSPAYENQTAGVALSIAGEQLKTDAAVKRVVRYEEIIIDSNFKEHLRRFVDFSVTLFAHFLRGNTVSKSQLSANYQRQKAPIDQKVIIDSPLYVVSSNVDNSAFNANAHFSSQAKANDFMREQINQDPSLAQSLHVIPATEMREAV